MIFPFCCFIISFPTSWQQKKSPRRLVSMIRSQSASVTSSADLRTITAALLTRISIFPKSPITRETSAATDDISLTSVGTATAFSPSFCRDSAACCPSAARRLAMTTAAPAAASPRAMARPIPWLPPVTMATFPERSKSSISCLLLKN